MSRVWLRRTADGGLSRWFLVVVSTVQLLICVSQTAVLLARNMYAFIALDGGLPAAEYFADQAQGLYIAYNGLYTINVSSTMLLHGMQAEDILRVKDWIGSGVLVWRAWAINGRSWKLCAPLVSKNLDLRSDGLAE